MATQACPFLFIPCQDGRFFDFENYHMTDVWAPFIDAGQVMVFAVDTTDRETWSDGYGDAGHRSWLYEQWINYLCEEVVPFARAMSQEFNQWDELPMVGVFGASLGATHAVNLYFKRPDLFDRLLALSGVYSSEYGFGGYMDDRLYFNSPVHYLSNQPEDHPFIEQYNQKKSRYLRRPGSLGGATVYQTAGRNSAAQRHPCAGGLLGLRLCSRLALVVQTGFLFPALPAEGRQRRRIKAACHFTGSGSSK
ncbi:MAG: hypothetical protein LUC90_08705 [Lachnospiraceae bacterium]|nr:hypothetical protein [Lachnospiraceae bacterium]